MARMFAEMPGASSVATKIPSQTILLLASRQAMYQSLAEAFQQHFQSYDVTLAESGSRLGHLAPRAQLILISARGADPAELADLLAHMRAEAPGVPVGLLVDEGNDLATLSGSEGVQGILPLWLPLDVLMAVASLLLAGGHYVPGGVVKRARPADALIAEEFGAPDPASGGAMARPPVEVDVATLTMREEQILQYVSEGFQNKLIASRMALSEHTVKAHVHKVIAKLGVTNRTQAAAAFLRRKNGGHFRAPGASRSVADQP